MVVEKGMIPDYAAPCGIYCRCCPSLGKTCEGCRSEKPQKRTSKYACYMRCCALEKGLGFCSECGEFPCKGYAKRFLVQHRNDVRYQYRRDAYADLRLVTEEGVAAWSLFQEEKWRCPACGEVVWMYSYECSGCHKKWIPA